MYYAVLLYVCCRAYLFQEAHVHYVICVCTLVQVCKGVCAQPICVGCGSTHAHVSFAHSQAVSMPALLAAVSMPALLAVTLLACAQVTGGRGKRKQLQLRYSHKIPAAREVLIFIQPGLHEVMYHSWPLLNARPAIAAQCTTLLFPSYSTYSWRSPSHDCAVTKYPSLSLPH